MTTAGPDRPLTAADLLFGSSADVPEALTRQILSAGRAQSLSRALERLPRVTREAAIRQSLSCASSNGPGSARRRLHVQWCPPPSSHRHRCRHTSSCR